jgi:NAD(P)-dependent dehydrogenase (short-subunit alcohol dehydrogenase family)
MSENTERKNIIVTGASRGIGAAVALAAGARGWSVAINYAGRTDRAQQVAEAVETAGGRAIVVQGDVSVEADVLRLFEEAVSAFGRIDGVVNNAGVIGTPSLPLAEIPLERMQRLFAVNTIGAMMVAREAARHMSHDRGGSGGCIVNISSAAARLGGPNDFVDYAASKGAIDTLTGGLAKELGPRGVRVNSVRPGLIDTEMNAERPLDQLVTTVPLRRAGQPDEIAEAVLWLLSDASSYVTGATLDVTGGR